MPTIDAINPMAVLQYMRSQEQQQIENQRNQERDQQDRAAFEMQRQRYAQEEIKYATDMAETNPDLVKTILPNLRALDPTQVKAVLQRAAQAKKAQSQTEGSALASQAVDASRGTSLQKQNVQDQILNQGGAGNPDFLNSMAAAMQAQQQKESQFAAGKSPTQLGDIAVAEAKARTASGIAEAVNERAEGRSTRSELVTQLTTVMEEALAAESQGIIGEGPVTELYRQIPDLIADGRITPKDAKYVMDVGKIKATALYAKELRKAGAPAGEVIATQIQATMAKAMEAPETMTTLDWAKLIDHKVAILDPAKGNQPLFFPNAPNTFVDSRGRLAAMRGESSNLLNYAKKVVQEVQAGTAIAGGIAGTDFAQSLLRLAGKQSGSVAGFMLAQQALLIDTARLGQDARLSDFDLLLWRAVVPGLIDMMPGPDGGLSEQALGRFAAINELIELQTELPYSPRMRPAVDERINQLKADLLSDPEVQRRSEIIDSNMEMGPDGKRVFKTGGVEAAAQAINFGKGATPLTGVPARPLSPENQALLDELNGG